MSTIIAYENNKFSAADCQNVSLSCDPQRDFTRENGNMELSVEIYNNGEKTLENKNLFASYHIYFNDERVGTAVPKAGDIDGDGAWLHGLGRIVVYAAGAILQAGQDGLVQILFGFFREAGRGNGDRQDRQEQEREQQGAHPFHHRTSFFG